MREAFIYSSAHGVPPTLVCKGTCIQLTWEICFKCEETQTREVGKGGPFWAMRNVCAGDILLLARKFQQKSASAVQHRFQNVSEVVRVLRNFYWLLAPQEEKGLIL